MKRLFSVLVFSLPSIFAIAQEAQESETSTPTRSVNKYFITTNSGVLNTPVGFRLGVIDRMGGYIGARFGKGYKYVEDGYNVVDSTEATLFAANVGIIFPIAIKNKFKVHSFAGIGYGKWFDRPSQNGQTVGMDLEAGLMLSYQKFMLNFGGNVLMGDGGSPRGDMTIGVGFRF